MTKEAIQPAGLAVPAKPYSPVIRSGAWVFVSGQIPIDDSGALVGGAFEEQLTQVLDNVERCLRAAGCGMGDVVKTVVYLTDRRHFDLLNLRYGERFAEPRPVRTTILCGLLDERFLVEMDVVAHIPAAEDDP